MSTEGPIAEKERKKENRQPKGGMGERPIAECYNNAVDPFFLFSADHIYCEHAVRPSPFLSTPEMANQC